MEQVPKTADLPRPHVLSYVATADSPTRVRQIGSRAVLALAIIHAVVAVVVMVCVALYILSLYRSHISFPWGPRRSLMDAVMEAAEHSAGWMVLAVYAMTAAAVFFGCFKPIGRGRTVACRVALLAIFPLIFACFMIAAGLFGAPIFALFEGGLDPLVVLLLLPGVIVVFVILLLGDLCSFLFWIAKNPITEKPPVPFLPE